MPTGIYKRIKPVWNKGKKGRVAWNKGLTKSDPRVAKYSEGISARMKGRATWNKGKPHLEAEKNPAWNGGSIKYKVRIAKERDNYICQMCGFTEKEIMVVDHIRPKYIRPDLYLSLDNLMTLCPNCHARKTIIDRKNIALFNKEKKSNE